MDHLQADLCSDIEAQVRERFRRVAVSPRGHFSYPTGREGLLALDYEGAALSALPEPVQECFCGVGNPFSAGLPETGGQVLDVGCGAGVDALVAAFYVGQTGSVTGLEFSREMLDVARANAALAGCGNARFVPGTAEVLPFADESFGLVLSNGVYNLVLRKRLALSEAFRVLRPGGKLQVADQILEGAAPLPVSQPLALSWAG